MKSNLLKIIEKELFDEETVSSTDMITLENTVEDMPLKIGISGNSYQETRDGKTNILNPYNLSDVAKNAGIQCDENQIISDTTPTSDSRGWGFENANWYLTLPAGEYSLLLLFTTQSTSSNAKVGVYKAGETIVPAENIANMNEKTVSFSLTEETEVGILVKNYDGIYKIQLSQGVKDYESYGAMPSIDYPSEIQACGANGSINEVVCNKNLFNSELEMGGYSGSNGQPYVSTTRIRSKEKTFLKAGTYTISSTKETFIAIECWNKDGTYNREYTSNKSSVTFTIENDSYIHVTAENTLLLESKIQLEEEEVATDYIAHEEQTISIPCQAEMLEDDYFDFDNEKEVHNWEKIESYNNEEITTEYKSSSGGLDTGATVYYKLATPLELNFTTEQKQALKELSKIVSYDNITHIYSTDETSANITATAKTSKIKKLETLSELAESEA